MTEFRQIRPEEYFVAQDVNGVYIGKKVDRSLLDRFRSAGFGNEHSMAIPEGANPSEYSTYARHNGHFNTQVVAAQDGISFIYDSSWSDRKVEAFDPKNLDQVIATLERQRKIHINPLIKSN